MSKSLPARTRILNVYWVVIALQKQGGVVFVTTLSFTSLDFYP